MIVSLVAAVARNNVIGRENKIPWRVRADLIHLKQLTLGHTVVLGRKTYDSMVGYYNRSGRPMPGKMYIVVTRNANYRPARPNAQIAHSIPQAIEQASRLNGDQVMVIGGARIYQQALPYATRLYMTRIEANIDGDTFFPRIDTSQWHQTFSEAHKKDEKNEYNYTFITLERAQQDLP